MWAWLPFCSFALIQTWGPRYDAASTKLLMKSLQSPAGGQAGLEETSGGFGTLLPYLPVRTLVGWDKRRERLVGLYVPTGS